MGAQVVALPGCADGSGDAAAVCSPPAARWTPTVRHRGEARNRRPPPTVHAPFQRKIALDSLAGSIVGAIAAGLVLLLLAGGGAAFAGDLMGTTPLRGSDLLILAMLPLVLVVLATWVARAAVLSTLRRAT